MWHGGVFVSALARVVWLLIYKVVRIRSCDKAHLVIDPCLLHVRLPGLRHAFPSTVACATALAHA